MRTLAGLSLKNRALIALVTICAAVFGVIGASSLKQELFPDFEMPQAVISASYEGASPEAVEREVTEVLENALTGVEEIESTASTSSAGMSQITVETAYGTNSDDTVRALQRAVSQVEGQLPDGVEPSVFSGGLGDFPVLAVSVTSDLAPDELAQKLEDIASPELSRIAGVRSVDVAGDRPKEIAVTIRRDDLDDEGASVDEIAGLLQANGVPTSAGELSSGTGTAPVEVGARLQSADDIADLMISGSDGPIPLSDVADVELRDATITSISRTNGQDSLTLSVTKKPDANTVEVSNAVKDELDAIAQKIGSNTEFSTVFDQAPFIEQSIEDLLHEGLLGLGFAVVVILVFLLSVRATVITAISIPLSLLITLIGMWVSGYSLNMLTMGALTISIGRVVDDSIVVIEAIRRRQSMGGEKLANIRAAVGEVAGAITASTLVTVAVFLPVAFVGGQSGELFRPFALTASIALLASLFVALTIVPVLAYWFLARRESKAKLSKAQKRTYAARRKEALSQWRAERRAALARPVDAANPPGRHATSELPVLGGRTLDAPQEIDELDAMRSPVTRLQKTYVPVVAWTTKHPVITLLVAVAVLVGTFAMTPLLKTEMFGDTGEEQVQITQTFDPGVDLAAASEQAAKVEDVLQKSDEVETVQLEINQGGMMGFGGGGGLSGTYIVNLAPGASTADFAAQAQKDVDALDGVGEVEVMSAGTVPGGSTIDVQLSGNDSAELETAAADLTEKLSDLEDIQSATSDVEAVQPVIEVRIDREKAADEGLTEQQIGQIVSRAMRGQQIGQIIVDDATRSVMLFDGDAETVDELRNLEITLAPEPAQPMPGVPAPASDPETIALDEIADVEEITTAPQITRVDGLRTVTVSAVPAGDDLGAASQEVRSAVDSFDLPETVSEEIGGATAEQQEAFTQLGIAMLAAILLVFVIMVATFKSLAQPLILLVSIPFAATGSIALLLLTDTPLGMTGLIGMLMLIGVVVTNAIVLIDLINQFRSRGVDLRTAVIQGARLRYRPIIMTAAATIFALIPMAAGLTGGGVFISKPLAIVVIGGLVSSTLLTLILVPVLYQLIEGRKERRLEKQALGDMIWDRVAEEREPAPAETRAPASAPSAGGEVGAAAGESADAPAGGGSSDGPEAGRS